jgi:oligoendopeptidase F
MTTKSQRILHRGEVPEKYKWNAESVFKSQGEFEDAFKKVEAMLHEVEEYKGRLSEGPEVLVDWFEFFEKLYRLGGKVYFYAMMSFNSDTTDPNAAELNGRAQGQRGNYFAAISFMDPELIAIGRAVLDTWISEEERLTPYAHYFDNLFRKQEHVQGTEVEEVLGMLTSPFLVTKTTYDMLNNADLPIKPAKNSDGEEVPVTQGTYFRILNQGDRELRRTAWKNYQDAYLAYKNTFASNLSATVRQDVFQARVRKYTSSLEAGLFPYNIPLEVFHNLMDVFKSHLPTWHRYFAMRRKALGLEKLHPYDIWAPLSLDEPVVPFDQAVDWISAGMRPLGEKYVETLRRGCLQDRWVDRYPNIGKQQGAFSFGWPGTFPFIMMSYNDDPKSMSTLAHELGHSLHSYLAWKAQPGIYSRYSLFVAEVASNFNQALVRAYMLENMGEPDFQIALLEEAMSNFHRYFLIMPTLARLELEVHEQVERGEGLTADGLIELMADLFTEAYGPEMYIDRARIGMTWAQFGHLYRNFYVYQYATGIAGAHALANRVLSGEKGAVEAYLNFLQAGSSKYPMDALKGAGVDLSSPEPVKVAFEVMSGYIDRLEELIVR